MLVINAPPRWVGWPDGKLNPKPGQPAFLMRGLLETERKAAAEATCTLASDTDGQPFLKRDELAYAELCARKIVSNWRGVQIDGKTKFSRALLRKAMLSREIQNFVIAQGRKLGAVIDDEETTAKED